MARVIDITDKLNFEEKPQIKIKDVTLTVNNEAVVVIEFLSKFKCLEPENVFDVAKLFLSEEDYQRLIGLKLNVKDLLLVMNEIIVAATGELEEPQGEAETPDMT